MNNEKVFISKIIFKDDSFLTFDYDDIVVFVGPNNSGKSQLLKDIYSLSESNHDYSNVILKSIEKTNEGVDPSVYLKRYGKIDKKVRLGSDFYNVLGDNILDGKRFNNKNYGTYRDLFIANLSTLNRLDIVNPPENINEEQFLSHPILHVGYNIDCQKWISSNFKKAFGKELIANTQIGNKVPLVIGNMPSFVDKQFKNEIERLAELRNELKSYDKVHEQGDGVKSFVGILLYLMLDFYKTFLIDEPESFLHQPQATMMGRIIGEATRDRQCFISTHSEYIIKGLLDTAPNRVKIIRVTREENINYFSVLNNDKITEIWNNPILRHSNIMSGLFYGNVVICESDSDCKLYSIINDYIKEKKGIFSETLFVHCGGKHRISSVATALRSLNIDTKAIVDIDILKEKETLALLVESMGGSFDLIKKDYHILISNIDVKGRYKTRNELSKLFNEILDSSSEKMVSDDELLKMQALLKPSSIWQSLKENGKAAIPSGDATNAANRVFSELNKLDIFVVTAGELESFVKEVGGHGPQWVNNVLQQYNDLDNDVYESIKEFVCSLEL